jgi:NADH:ubiquinone oxidoreductase subunit D
LVQINLGPQHPSTHGVLRIIGIIECETIKSCEPELGLLHRGSEKLIEYRC